MDVISLTQKLIRFNTINPPGNEEEIAKYVWAIHENKLAFQIFEETLGEPVNI